ncbi:pilus assembly protein TadG-related protein [Nocardioides sp. MH1]|uniref:pilus assembly protein TadG-related protein n=1 Tax=Nocardioides sp. MH1 TaxID=3242490 RepID=UPI0035210DC4
MDRAERGSSSVMIIGFALVVVLLVAVVIDAGAAYLERQDLDSLADGAALYGADAAAEGRDVYAGGLGRQDLHLSADVARAAVGDYLRSTGAYADHPGLHASVTVRDDRVVVEVVAPLALPLDLPGAAVRPTVRARGSAVVRPEEGDAARSNSSFLHPAWQFLSRC